jgi:hypothetical protein
MTAARGVPSSPELLAVIGRHLDELVPRLEGRVRFHTLIARRVLAAIERELVAGPHFASGHARRLAASTHASDAAFAEAIRAGRHDDCIDDVIFALRESTTEQLAIANPSYLTPSDRRDLDHYDPLGGTHSNAGISR